MDWSSRTVSTQVPYGVLCVPFLGNCCSQYAWAICTRLHVPLKENLRALELDRMQANSKSLPVFFRISGCQLVSDRVKDLSLMMEVLSYVGTSLPNFARQSKHRAVCAYVRLCVLVPSPQMAVRSSKAVQYRTELEGEVHVTTIQVAFVSTRRSPQLSTAHHHMVQNGRDSH